MSGNPSGSESVKPMPEGSNVDYEEMRNEALQDSPERPEAEAEVFEAILAKQKQVYRTPATFGEAPKDPSPNQPFYAVGTPGPAAGVIRPHYSATATVNPDTKAWTFTARHRITNSPTEELPRIVTVSSTPNDLVVARDSAPSDAQLGKEGESSSSRLSWAKPEDRDHIKYWLDHVKGTLSGEEDLQDWVR